MHFEFGVFVVIVTFFLEFLHCDRIDAYSEVDTSENDRNTMLCHNLKPQHSVNIEHILGPWFGNEIIVHSSDFPGIYKYKTCVTVQLSDVTEDMETNYNYNDNNNNNYRRPSSTVQHYEQQYYQQNQHQQQQQHQYHQQQQQQDQQLQQRNRQQQFSNEPYSATKFLRLVWSENNDNLEYIFNYTDLSPGLWHNVGEQRGSLLAFKQYKQFTGSVQVVKAVNDHLVLTFCGTNEDSSIFSLVLSRQLLGLSNEEIGGIRNLLSRRGLSTSTIRKVCSAAATERRISLAFAVLLGLIVMISK